MMLLEDALFATLKNLVGNRMSPVVFPQPPAVPVWPAIRYAINTTPVQDLCGAGDDGTADARVQLDVVAERYPQARLLRQQVMALMNTFDPPARLQFSTEEYDEETKTHRQILQYEITPSSSLESP